MTDHATIGTGSEIWAEWLAAAPLGTYNWRFRIISIWTFEGGMALPLRECLTLAILLTLTLAGCNTKEKEEGYPYKSRVAHFKATFPVEPTHVFHRKDRQHTFTCLYGTKEGFINCEVLFFEKRDKRVDIEDRVAAALESQDMDMTSTAVANLSTDTYQCREVSFSGDDVLTNLRIYHSGSDYYSVSVVRQKGTFEADTKRFLASFEILAKEP